jgi:O-antigen/teichoic acid export membrane protein
MLDKLKIISTGSENRSRRANFNILISFISKGISILVSFLIVPITLSFITKEEYAVWIVLSSTIAWFGFLDLGLGNGLRNKLSESLAKGDELMAKEWISSTVFSMLAIASLLLLVLSLLVNFFSCQAIFNVYLISERGLKTVLHFIVVLFCFDFLTKIFVNVLQALQKHFITDILGIISQLLGLLLIYFLTHVTEGSLLKLCIVYAGKSPIVFGAAAIFMFATSLRYLRPSWKYVHVRRSLPLLKLGLKFFLIQIFYLVVNQGAVMLITQNLGPEHVTGYSLGLRYMSIPSMLFTMVLTPYITAFNEAYVKDEYFWIQNTMKRLRMFWYFVLIIIGLLVLIKPWFFSMWIDDQVNVSPYLIIALAFNAAISTWGVQYSLFLNGIGKVSIQVYVLLLQAIVFITVTLLLFQWGFGVSSSVIALSIVTLLANIVMYIQYKRVIEKTAVGIWNR